MQTIACSLLRHIILEGALLGWESGLRWKSRMCCTKRALPVVAISSARRILRHYEYFIFWYFGLHSARCSSVMTSSNQRDGLLCIGVRALGADNCHGERFSRPRIWTRSSSLIKSEAVYVQCMQWDCMRWIYYGQLSACMKRTNRVLFDLVFPHLWS